MPFTYAQVEATLARLFDADPEVQRKTFRARIVHLRRVGIPLGFSPGRGKRIAYELEQVYQLGLCLELEEMGLDPSLISRLMETFWANMLYPLLIEEEQELGFSLGPVDIPDDLLFAIYPKFMSGQWDRHPYSPEGFQEFVDFRPFRFDKAVEGAKAALSASRTCTLNLSAFIRSIRQSLMEVGAGEDLPDHLKSGVPEAKVYERALTRPADQGTEAILDAIPEER